MADFSPSFEKMIANEGGYQLTNIGGDRGGQTYAGIARNMHPNWPGWPLIDAGKLHDLSLSALVRSFYKSEFWDKLSADSIEPQTTADAVFDFAVNAGWLTAAKLAQLVVGTVPDGRIGPQTLSKLNAMPPEQFTAHYALAKIARYAEICNKDKTQSKFLLGWVNRTLKGLS